MPWILRPPVGALPLLIASRFAYALFHSRGNEIRSGGAKEEGKQAREDGARHIDHVRGRLRGTDQSRNQVHVQYETVHDRDTSYYRTHGVPPSASIAEMPLEDRRRLKRQGAIRQRERERRIEKWEQKETRRDRRRDRNGDRGKLTITLQGLADPRGQHCYLHYWYLANQLSSLSLVHSVSLCPYAIATIRDTPLFFRVRFHIAAPRASGAVNFHAQHAHERERGRERELSLYFCNPSRETDTAVRATRYNVSRKKGEMR